MIHFTLIFPYQLIYFNFSTFCFNVKLIDIKSEGTLCSFQTKSTSQFSTSYNFIGIGYCKTKTPCWSYIFILQCHLKNIRNNSLETKKRFELYGFAIGALIDIAIRKKWHNIKRIKICSSRVVGIFDDNFHSLLTLCRRNEANDIANFDQNSIMCLNTIVLHFCVKSIVKQSQDQEIIFGRSCI